MGSNLIQPEMTGCVIWGICGDTPRLYGYIMLYNVINRILVIGEYVGKYRALFFVGDMCGYPHPKKYPVHPIEGKLWVYHGDFRYQQAMGMYNGEREFKQHMKHVGNWNMLATDTAC